MEGLKNIPQQRINGLIEYKNNWLLRELCNGKTKEEQKEIVEKLYKSKTFECLQECNTRFFIKSNAELLYLLGKEYKGDWAAWKAQSRL